jgi:hypothetical protein
MRLCPTVSMVGTSNVELGCLYMAEVFVSESVLVRRIPPGRDIQVFDEEDLSMGFLNYSY